MNDGLPRLQAVVDYGLRVEGNGFRAGFGLMLDALHAQDGCPVVPLDAHAVFLAECDALGIKD